MVSEHLERVGGIPRIREREAGVGEAPRPLERLLVERRVNAGERLGSAGPGVDGLHRFETRRYSQRGYASEHDGGEQPRLGEEPRKHITGIPKAREEADEPHEHEEVRHGLRGSAPS